MKEDNPGIVFLVSQPRSGSTLLQSVLGRNSRVYTCSEPWIALPLVYGMKRSECEFEFNGVTSRKAIDNFFAENGVTDDFFYSETGRYLGSLYRKCLEGSGKDIFLDKTPRYYEILQDLARALPGAKFVLLHRNPLSVLTSILQSWMYGDLRRLALCQRDLHAAPHRMLDFENGLAGDRLVVRYEDLVTSPREEVARLCSFLEVEFEPEMLQVGDVGTFFLGDRNTKELVGLCDSSVDSWRGPFRERHMKNFLHYYLEDLGRETVERFGYDYDLLLGEVEKMKPNGRDRRKWRALAKSRGVHVAPEMSLPQKKVKGDSAGGKDRPCR
jgi:hypothetical protein